MTRWALALAVLTACGPARPPAAAIAVDDPALLAEPSAIAGDFLAEQTVVARFDGREIAFRAVLQKARGRLTLVALSLQGTRLFVLEQAGRQVEFRTYVGQELPFSPRHILVDIHRTYFRTGDVAGERVADRRVGDRVVERVIRIDGAGAGRIAIRYGDGGASLLERPVRFSNGYLGYTLEVTPTRFTPL